MAFVHASRSDHTPLTAGRLLSMPHLRSGSPWSFRKGGLFDPHNRLGRWIFTSSSYL